MTRSDSGQSVRSSLIKVLATIPHFFEAGGAQHGSLAADPALRLAAFSSNLTQLHRNFSQKQGMFDITSSAIYQVNQALNLEIDVVVLTTRDKHVLDRLSLPERITFKHEATDVEPMLLGFECLKVHKREAGRYDFHCYLEDDLSIPDPWFFRKLEWFNQSFGDDKVLMPNRFEVASSAPFDKVYVDGNMPRHWIESFKDLSVEPVISAKFLGQNIEFFRPPNPIGPGFYLNSNQFSKWASQAYFLDYDQRFIGPIESSYTLGILKTFQVYKSSPANACFLEVHHLDNRYLDKRLRFG